jgi:hypothetical protein
MDRIRKRPRDPNQLAKMLVDIVAGEVEDKEPLNGKDPAAVTRYTSAPATQSATI